MMAMQPYPPEQRSRTLALINARLLDPASRLDRPGGLLIRDGLIIDLGPHIAEGALATPRSSIAAATCSRPVSST